MSTTFLAKAKEGTLEMAPMTRAKFREWLKTHDGARIEIEGITPESSKKRRFFEGGVVGLVTYYQENLDHRNPAHRRQVREWLKLEFNGEMVLIGGKMKVVGKSTKGVLNDYTEKVVEWLDENYKPPKEALDPKKYKYWRDAIFPFGGPDNYIDYLIEIGVLRPMQSEGLKGLDVAVRGEKSHA